MTSMAFANGALVVALNDVRLFPNHRFDCSLHCSRCLHLALVVAAVRSVADNNDADADAVRLCGYDDGIGENV